MPVTTGKQEFVVEIKEVYIVKYKCVGESKEEITEQYVKDPLFNRRLIEMHEPMEYYCDADEDTPHRVLTMKEYNDENEASDKAASETEEKASLSDQLHGEIDPYLEGIMNRVEDEDIVKHEFSGTLETQKEIEEDEFVIDEE